MHPFFENLLECMTEDLFLQEFSRKYHYDEGQMALLKEVSFAMQQRIRDDNRTGKAGWEDKVTRETFREKLRETIDGPQTELLCPACITLGPGVDELQETYLATERLTEGYMVETLGSELLLKSYPQWNEQIAAQGSYRVKRYYFLGSEEQYPIRELPTLLEGLRVPVSCTSAYCMLPKKSVAFYARLIRRKEIPAQADEVQGNEAQTNEAQVNEGYADKLQATAAERDEHFCEGICAGCNSTNCPNRMEKRHGSAWEADMTDRPFTYGYQRIFGMR